MEEIKSKKRGPKPGYKQSAEHIEKRKRFGEDHPGWKGDQISVRGGRSRAKRIFTETQPCEICGSEKTERHQKDENTANNSSENIQFLCRACHTKMHILRLRKVARENLELAIAAAAEKKRKQTHCKRGHELSGSNLYINKRGSRVCKECRKIHIQK